eukprot:gnl/TRDRNA2_/TRDRNA2_171605_c1_seq1.p1 gnl/TRDRNA2_/TRDRNA2_171605_c1~~gnl/TRDRNA2_/TRDRNA2_171605_c1_seq1.p1  ORF type:complete len:234 (-),score=53.03 gnl/TRDRNA2_/TRDRNA2_171605_c1_seq1:237-860(-)
MMVVQEFNKDFLDMFNKYDKDSSGTLPADQLQELLKEVNGGVKPNSKDVAFLLKRLEPRGQADPIGVSQLKAALACWYCLQPTVQDEIKAMFKSWDTAGNGVITQDEFAAVMTKLSPAFTPERTAALFKSADTKKTGVLDYEEFVDFIWSTGVAVGTGVEKESAKGAFSTGGALVPNARGEVQSSGGGGGPAPVFSTGGALTANARG